MVTSSKPVAGQRVADRQGEESDAGSQQYEIKHGSFPSLKRSGDRPRHVRKRCEVLAYNINEK
jgi:hypothetical protein